MHAHIAHIPAIYSGWIFAANTKKCIKLRWMETICCVRLSLTWAPQVDKIAVFDPFIKTANHFCHSSRFSLNLIEINSLFGEKMADFDFYNFNVSNNLCWSRQELYAFTKHSKSRKSLTVHCSNFSLYLSYLQNTVGLKYCGPIIC